MGAEIHIDDPGVSTLSIGDLIAGSTAGSVLFVGALGDLQQDNANFFWDNTLKRLGIGNLAPANTLDVTGTFHLSSRAAIGTPVVATAMLSILTVGGLAKGLDVLSTNINSAAVFTGSGGGPNIVTINQNSNVGNSIGLLIDNTSTLAATTATGIKSLVNGANAGGDNVAGHFSASGALNNLALYIASGNLGIGLSALGTGAEKVLAILNGVSPGTSPADAFQLYSADIVAGNAAPHFRTELGDIVKIFADSGWGTPTGGSSKLTFDTTTVTVEQLAERVAALIITLKTSHGLFKA